MPDDVRSPMAPDRWGAVTHTVDNVPAPLEDTNTYTGDIALLEAVHRYAPDPPQAALAAFGALAGSAEYLALGFEANAHPPTFTPHDRGGRRVDLVRYHPSYHRLMDSAMTHGLHASHWEATEPDAHVGRATRMFLQSQVEAGHICPVTMTSGAIPTLAHQPELLTTWGPKILSRGYDPSNIPAEAKAHVTVGMAMTEKQGGSDVRANSTTAEPIDPRSTGPGQAYALVGHKYFVSAPMSDLFLVLAQAPGGLSCFLLPRWRADGSKNPIQIQRLKPKMANVSNASSETELRGATGWMVGDEGHGVRTIIDMVAMTRFDCMIGSASGMRASLAQAAHHCAHRRAFGARLSDQPLMRNVLADLAVESEAATVMTLRVGHALDEAAAGDTDARALVRIATAVGKYWICKRHPEHAYEAMECIGGSGVMDEHLTARLFRDAPINAIWEGSGNVQALDLLRTLARSPHSVKVFLHELSSARGADRVYDQAVDELTSDLDGATAALADGGGHAPAFAARDLIARMALLFQAALLLDGGDATVAQAFLVSRIHPGALGRGLLYGTLPKTVDTGYLTARAMPA